MKNQKSETVPEPPAAVQALERGDWWISSSSAWDGTPKRQDTERAGANPALIFLKQQKENP